MGAKDGRGSGGWFRCFTFPVAKSMTTMVVPVAHHNIPLVSAMDMQESTREFSSGNPTMRSGVNVRVFHSVNVPHNVPDQTCGCICCKVFRVSQDARLKR
jgi:hypothetical protein